MSVPSLQQNARTRSRLYLTFALLIICLSPRVAMASETEEPRAPAAARSRLGLALLGSIVVGGTAAGVGLLAAGANPHAGAASDKRLGGGLLLGVSGACLVGVIVAAMHRPRPRTTH